MTLYFLLPAYNEAENIPALLEKIGALAKTVPQACRVVLVDDGSSDQTAAVARNAQPGLDVIIVQHPRNLGLAEALRSGLRKILSIAGKDDWVVTMDADNSHHPELVQDMLSLCPPAVGAIASRYLPGSAEVGLSPRRRLLSRACNMFLRAAFPIRGVTDYTSGYRMVSVPLIASLSEKTSGKFFEAQGFVATSELLINLARAGGVFREVPLVLRYDLKKGESKMRALRTIFGYAGLLVRRGMSV